MFKKSFFFGTFLVSLIFSLILTTIYINREKSLNSKEIQIKNKFVKVTQLPDLALSTEAPFIRHRTLTDLFEIYKDDGTLREYIPSTYVYAYSNLYKLKKDFK